MEDESFLKKAVEALKNEQVPPGPSEILTNATISKLDEISGKTDRIIAGNRTWIIRNFAKVAVAAVLMIAAGYITGRLSAPRQPDMKQLQDTLEPTIRQNLLDEMKQYLQLGLTSGYVRIHNELSQQYQQDLDRLALQTFAASNAVTSELLTELIESINTAQVQDRQWVTAALEQIESNRLNDRNRLGNALISFAYRTEDELQRTKQDLAQVLSYTRPDSSDIYEINNSDSSIERTRE